MHCSTASAVRWASIGGWWRSTVVGTAGPPTRRRPFHYESMVDETIAVIEHIGGPVHIVGWSDGGIVGLLLALRRPELVGRLVAIGANYHWDVVPDLSRCRTHVDERRRRGQDGRRPRRDDPVDGVMAAAYAERSPDGPDHFAVVAAKGFHLFGIEPELTVEDLARVSVPVLVMAGDDDIIPLSHTAAFFAGLPDAQLAIVPGASHGLPIEHPQEVVGLIERFLRIRRPARDDDAPPASLRRPRPPPLRQYERGMPRTCWPTYARIRLVEIGATW